MSEIIKEIPSGVIDGNNKIFTLLNTPEYVNDLWIDGGIYTSFSLNGNQITLTDAPTLSLFVDYVVASTTVQTSTNVTWGDVKEKIWSNLGQTSSSTIFSNDVLDAEMNSLVNDIYRGRVQNPINSRIYRAGSLSFINGSTRFRYIPNSSVTVESLVGDTEISMDTTLMLSAGVVEIGGDSITYTGKTDTQITGVSGNTINHLVGEVVLTLYPLPIEADKPNKVEYIVNNTSNKKGELDLDNTGTYGKYYQVIKNINETYIKVIGLYHNDIVDVEYIKKREYITDDTTVFPIPDSYGLSAVANIISGTLGYGKGIPNSEQQLMIGFTNLQSCFQYYTNEINVIKQSLKAKPYSAMRRS